MGGAVCCEDLGAGGCRRTQELTDAEERESSSVALGGLSCVHARAVKLMSRHMREPLCLGEERSVVDGLERAEKRSLV